MTCSVRWPRDFASPGVGRRAGHESSVVEMAVGSAVGICVGFPVTEGANHRTFLEKRKGWAWGLRVGWSDPGFGRQALVGPLGSLQPTR
jgi:hypothetical protein